MARKTEQRDKYYPKLKNLIESLGEWNVNLHQLNRDWDIPVTTLHRWKDKVIEQIGLIDLSRAGREIEEAMIHNMKVCRQILAKSENMKVKLDTIKTFNETQDKYTEFMESYGKKNKVAEKVEISRGELSEAEDYLNTFLGVSKSSPENPDSKGGQNNTK